MRIALGAAWLAAASALAAAIVLPPRPAVSTPITYGPQAALGAAGTVVAAQPTILYVQLQPGQTPPPGAAVVGSSAQPAATANGVAPAVQTPVTIRTTQSGKVIP